MAKKSRAVGKKEAAASTKPAAAVKAAADTKAEAEVKAKAEAGAKKKAEAEAKKKAEAEKKAKAAKAAAEKKEENDRIFAQRLGRHHDELRWLYMELYGNDDMFAELTNSNSSMRSARLQASGTASAIWSA